MQHLTTRNAAEKHLRELLGPYNRAIEALLKETGPDRHARRIIAAREAAKAWVIAHYDVGTHPLDDATIAAYANAVLLADCFGIGGRHGVSGAGTARHPAFAGLGRGRKHAADGPAWDAAIRDAVDSSPGYFRPGGGGTTSLFFEAGGVLICPGAAIIPHAWQYTIAREGLRRSVGLDPWFPELVGYVLASQDNCADWARVVEYLGLELTRPLSRLLGREANAGY
jgi:hypothetical protein